MENVEISGQFENIYESLLDEIKNKNIDILQINTQEFDLYDLSLFNEFINLPKIEQLQLLNIQTAKEWLPVVSQVSPISKVRALVLNISISPEELNAILNPGVESISLAYNSISVSHLKELGRCSIKYCNLASSKVQSLLSLMKALPDCAHLVLEEATTFELILLSAQFGRIQVNQLSCAAIPQQFTVSLYSEVDRQLRQRGAELLLASQQLISALDSNADVVLAGSSANALDCQSMDECVFWFRLKDSVYRRWENMLRQQALPDMQELIVYPENRDSYSQCLNQVQKYFNVEALEVFGLTGASEQAKAFIDEYAKTHTNLCLKRSDQNAIYQGTVTIIDYDEYGRRTLKPYAKQRRNVFK